MLSKTRKTTTPITKNGKVPSLVFALTFSFTSMSHANETSALDGVWHADFNSKSPTFVIFEGYGSFNADGCRYAFKIENAKSSDAKPDPDNLTTCPNTINAKFNFSNIENTINQQLLAVEFEKPLGIANLEEKTYFFGAANLTHEIYKPAPPSLAIRSIRPGMSLDKAQETLASQGYKAFRLYENGHSSETIFRSQSHSKIMLTKAAKEGQLDDIITLNYFENLGTGKDEIFYITREFTLSGKETLAGFRSAYSELTGTKISNDSGSLVIGFDTEWNPKILTKVTLKERNNQPKSISNLEFIPDGLCEGNCRAFSSFSTRIAPDGKRVIFMSSLDVDKWRELGRSERFVWPGHIRLPKSDFDEYSDAQPTRPKL